MTLRRVISGGQTGVDRGALDAALEAGMDIGGHCPAGRTAEDGVIPDHYPLTETATGDPDERTRANVEHAHATLILRTTGPSPGTDLTGRLCRELKRPALQLHLDPSLDASGPQVPQLRAAIGAWLGAVRAETLNVAGPRESEAPGVHAMARALLAPVFQSLTKEAHP